MPVNDFAMNMNVVEDAQRRGISLSAFLETLDPTSAYPEHERGMDAFRRQLARLDIRTASDLNIGLVAHPFIRFMENEGLDGGSDRKSLMFEWVNRQYRKGSFQGRPSGPMLYTDLVNGRSGGATSPWSVANGARFPVDVPVNYTLFPPAIADQLRYQEVQPSALQYLIARTRPIDSETFKALYLQNDNPGGTAQTGARMKRVAEFGEPNNWSFSTGENSITVVKYANSLRLSYEQMRRMNIDLVGWAIQYIAAMADLDKEASAVNILINGDGNSGTSATSTNGSSLDAGAGGALTLKMWLKWRYLWTRPYTCRVIIAPSNDLVSTFLLSAGSANVAPGNYLNSNQSNAVNITPVRTVLEGVLAVDNTTAAANTLVGIDSTAALEMVVEANSSIVQMDQTIRNQYNEIVMSENIGWDICIKNQNRVLAYTA